MYLDFEDSHPETPRVPQVISRREGVLLSFIAHLLFVIGYLVWPEGSQAVQQPVIPPQESLRYVQMTPLVDKLRAPRLTPEMSDMDRRSSTRERPRDAENPIAFSRGNTPEKTIGANQPEERAAGPATPNPSQPSPPSPPPPDVAAKVTPDAMYLPAAPPQPPPSGGLGNSLRNLQRYLQDGNLNNQRGGLTEQDPDIQFDSKGVEFGPWLRRFVAQVKRNWYVPQAAWTLKGRVIIQFYVLKDGTILDIRVVQPAGVEGFNVAAFNALKMSNPTAALPTEYPSDRVFFTVTFHYNEGNDR
jgi:TonB family protein